MRRFTIRRDNFDDYWVLKTYSTAVNMRIGITRDGGTPDAECVARVQPTITLYRDGAPGTFTSNAFATMYLNQEWMGVDLLSHECVHLALAHDRFVLRYRMYYGTQCGAAEEALAYYQGDALNSLIKLLFKEKLL
jgi:hypothetical protein